MNAYVFTVDMGRVNNVPQIQEVKILASTMMEAEDKIKDQLPDVWLIQVTKVY